MARMARTLNAIHWNVAQGGCITCHRAKVTLLDHHWHGIGLCVGCKVRLVEARAERDRINTEPLPF